jgi:thiol-disulfide isomerase/thioredoxin
MRAVRFGVLLVLVLVAVGCTRGSDNAKPVSGEAPDFTLPAVDGSIVKLSDYSGDVILVDFWATWCPPCIEMIPALSKIHRNYKDKGVTLLSVSMDNESLEFMANFVYESNIPYKVLLGNRKVGNLFGGVASIPTLFIIDRENKLVRKLMGYHSYGQLEDEIKKYL